jgi:adenylate kinase family enzyme
MEKVAVFGNTGGGKSTLSKRVAEIAGLPLYALDLIQFRSGGVRVSNEDFCRAHQEILARDRWVIDGFGSMETLWQRLDLADTLIYIDLPLYVHCWWVTKRALAASVKPPEGWPEHSPILKSSLDCYRVLWLCHTFLTPKYREYVDRTNSTKNVYHLKSTVAIADFIQSIEDRYKN